MERVLEKINFQKFLDDLKRKYKVIGPIRKGGATSTYSYACFGYIEELEDLEINYKSSMLSPKMIFFPDNKELYKYEKTNSKVRLTDLRDIWNEDVVILGLHPCDIAAISCLDKVFTEEGFEDQYYRAKREKSIIIGLTCSETKSSCFCNMVDSGPDIERGYDLLMTDIGDGYFFRAATELGKSLISADYFRDITEEDSKQRKQEIEKVTKELPPKLGVGNIAKVMQEKYDDDLWTEFSDRCLTCGSCNMVCPTCHCFSIIDKTNSDRTEGMRVGLIPTKVRKLS